MHCWRGQPSKGWFVGSNLRPQLLEPIILTCQRNTDHHRPHMEHMRGRTIHPICHRASACRQLALCTALLLPQLIVCTFSKPYRCSEEGLGALWKARHTRKGTSSWDQPYLDTFTPLHVLPSAYATNFRRPYEASKASKGFITYNL